MIHINGNETENYILEEGKIKHFYYIKNDSIVYQMDIDIKENSINVNIKNSYGEKIGELKIEKEEDTETINYSFDNKEKKVEIIYSNKETEKKENKSYSYLRQLSFKRIENNKSTINGDITVTTEVRNQAKIEEDVSNALLSSKITEEQKELMKNKKETIKNRLEQ